EGDVARARDENSVGDRWLRLDFDGVPRRERRREGRRVLGLDADDAHRAALFCRTGLDGARDARDETPAADAHDDRVDLGEVVVDLEADRALADDDVAVIEGRDVDGPR